MKIQTDGDGVRITMSGDEVALAISSWILAKGLNVHGPRTINVNGDLCREGSVYVDPSGFVEKKGKTWSGAHRSK